MLISFCMRGCGCIVHPAFPAPSIFLGANGSNTARARSAPRDGGGASCRDAPVNLNDARPGQCCAHDASAVAHTLGQKGELTVWQYNVHRGTNGELQQAPTAKIG